MLTVNNESPPPDSLGERIFDLRQKNGLSLEQLSRQLGVRARTLKNWETDRSEPRINKLVALAGLLGVAPTYLIAREGYGGSADTGIPAGPSSDIQAVAGLRRQLDELESKHKQSLKLIRQMRKQIQDL